MNEKMKYSIDGINRGIRAARNNIKTFEEAIEKEKQTIAMLKKMKSEIQRKDAERKVLIVKVPEGDQNDDSHGLNN